MLLTVLAAFKLGLSGAMSLSSDEEGRQVRMAVSTETALAVAATEGSAATMPAHLPENAHQYTRDAGRPASSAQGSVQVAANPSQASKAAPAGSIRLAEAMSPREAHAAVPPQNEQPLDWKAIKEREAELNRKEQDLRDLERELDTRLRELNKLEARLKGLLEQADVVKDQKLKHLVDVYSNMKSKQAAQAMERLDQRIAVKILAGMRGRQAGEIMSNMNSDKAATLSEALTRMQVPFEN